MQLPPESIEYVLDAWPVARLATLSSDGRPHPVPVVFARSAGALWSPVDAKPKRSTDLARVRNARRDPRVALLLDAYHDDWTRLWWLRVDGEAVVVEAPDPDADPEVRAAAAALHAKYPQYRDVAPFAGTPTLLRVTPTRLRSWCAGPEAVPRPAG